MEQGGLVLYHRGLANYDSPVSNEKLENVNSTIKLINLSFSPLVNHTGCSCHIHTLISLLHLQYNETFSNAPTRSYLFSSYKNG